MGQPDVDVAAERFAGDQGHVPSFSKKGRQVGWGSRWADPSSVL